VFLFAIDVGTYLQYLTPRLPSRTLWMTFLIVYTPLFVLFLPAGLRDAQPRRCRYCFYSVVQKSAIRLAGATHCPDKREIWHERADCRSLPRAKFHVYRGTNMKIQPPKLPKFRILARNLPLRGDSFAQFL